MGSCTQVGATIRSLPLAVLTPDITAALFPVVRCADLGFAQLRLALLYSRRSPTFYDHLRTHWVSSLRG
jgi:hypothetical protein